MKRIEYGKGIEMKGVQRIEISPHNTKGEMLSLYEDTTNSVWTVSVIFYCSSFQVVYQGSMISDKERRENQRRHTEHGEPGAVCDINSQGTPITICFDCQLSGVLSNICSPFLSSDIMLPWYTT